MSILRIAFLIQPTHPPITPYSLCHRPEEFIRLALALHHLGAHRCEATEVLARLELIDGLFGGEGGGVGVGVVDERGSN